MLRERTEHHQKESGGENLWREKRKIKWPQEIIGLHGSQVLLLYNVNVKVATTSI